MEVFFRKEMTHASVQNQRTRVVLFDPLIVGHHVEYLRHLIDYVVRTGARELHLIVHPELETHAPQLSAQVDAYPEYVTLHPLQEEEFEKIQEADIFRRALAGWNALDRRARAIGADHGVLMEINTYQPVLGLPRARALPYDISGILFFPYCRIEARADRWWTQGRRAIERTRKYLQLQWVLSNPSMRRIFVLNDAAAAATLRGIHETNAFTSLPDPVPPHEEATREEVEWVKTHWNDEIRKHFLLFGSLRRQKGILTLIEAVRGLSASYCQDIALHLLGKPREDMKGKLGRMIADLREACPDLLLHYEGRYLSDAELAQAIDASAVVLAPYHQTEGSSGVIGHAAKHRRPVLGPETGLIGELIREYDLGVTVNTKAPEALREALKKCLNDVSIGSEKGMEEYISERTPSAFARRLLLSLGE